MSIFILGDFETIIETIPFFLIIIRLDSNVVHQFIFIRVIRTEDLLSSINFVPISFSWNQFLIVRQLFIKTQKAFVTIIDAFLLDRFIVLVVDAILYVGIILKCFEDSYQAIAQRSSSSSKSSTFLTGYASVLM